MTTDSASLWAWPQHQPLLGELSKAAIALPIGDSDLQTDWPFTLEPQI